MGKDESSFIKVTSLTPLLFIWYPSSEPIRHDTARFRARSTSHAVALLLKGCTNIPLAAGQAQENETILFQRVFKPGDAAVRSTGSTRTYGSWRLRNSVRRRRQGFFIRAPSMTTPAVTYFQSATSSLRATATIVGFLRPPPLPTRSLNHRVNAVSG